MVRTRSNAIVGEICFYGNATLGTGAGWLATMADHRMFGDGEPRKDVTFTAALWQAHEALRNAGVGPGIIRVYMPGGTRMADIRSERASGYYGELNWVPATVLEIPAAELMAVFLCELQAGGLCGPASEPDELRD